jgi:hypothetical protein
MFCLFWLITIVMILECMTIDGVWILECVTIDGVWIGEWIY